MKKKKKINGWRDVWTPPFAGLEGALVFDSKGVVAWQWLFWNEEIQKDITCIINGVLYRRKLAHEVTVNGCEILLDGRPIICVRGWGHLIGTGALNLPADEATKIQDDFIKWIYSKLKGELKDDRSE